jgi:hypothetical protein
MTFVIKSNSSIEKTSNATNALVAQVLNRIAMNLEPPEVLIPIPLTANGPSNIQLTSCGKGSIGICGGWAFYATAHKKYAAMNLDSRSFIDTHDTRDEIAYAKSQLEQFARDIREQGPMRTMYGADPYGRPSPYDQPMYREYSEPQHFRNPAPRLMPPPPTPRFEVVHDEPTPAPPPAPRKSSVIAAMEAKIAELQQEKELKEKIQQLTALTAPAEPPKAASPARAAAFELGAFITKEIIAVIIAALYIANSVAPQHHQPRAEVAPRGMDANTDFFKFLHKNQMDFMEALSKKQDNFAETITNLLTKLIDKFTPAPAQAVATVQHDHNSNPEPRRKNYDTRVQTWEQQEYANYQQFYDNEERAKYKRAEPVIERIEPAPPPPPAPKQVAIPVDNSWNWAQIIFYGALVVFIWMAIFKIATDFLQ